jgi:hypothetical protein
LAKLPKLGQRITCTLPGYEDVWGVVWVNAPQSVLDNWQKLREESIERDERGRPLPMLDENGEVVTDPETFEPLERVDREAVLEASRFFISTMLLEFSINEDLDGNPLSPQDADFLLRLPEDLIAWVYNALVAAIEDRRNAGKGAVKLAEISGR